MVDHCLRTARQCRDQKTGSIPYNADAGTVSAALRSITPVAGICYSVTVQRSNVANGYTWSLTMQCLNPRPPYPNILVYTSGLTSEGSGAAVTLTYGVPVAQGAPLSGTFRLQVGGHWTTPIPFDASMDVFQAAVNSAAPGYSIKVESYNWSPLTGGRWAPRSLRTTR